SAQKEGETRLQLLHRNASIISSISGEIAAQASQGVLVIVSNPVDVLTYVALKRTGWERNRVIGSGTVLDSARLRYAISRNCEVDMHNVHAYVLGEHGDSEFVAWSMTHIAGMPIEQFCPLCSHCGNWKARRGEIEQEVRDAAYQIINYKGSTHFSVGMALVRITEAILRGQNSVLSVSTLLDGEYGLKNVSLSVPSIVSRGGVERIIEGKLNEHEMEALTRSAEVLQSAAQELGLG
ncbi:MAG: L-lactate dehydrogenase, partial [Anaerolineaceae bacterium]